MISPLRYPGGKAKIYKTVRRIINANGLNRRTYVEPFSGGFGLGIKLLLNRDVERVIINDLDRHIYTFWISVFEHTEKLIERIRNTEVSLQQWYLQKAIYNNMEQHTDLEIGFATLFLNRTNYSGVLTGGPIGGVAQASKYKIDCRFNKERIIDLIRQIAAQRDNVEIYNMDASALIQMLRGRERNIFYNFDPPYVEKGSVLYLNAFGLNNHVNLRNIVRQVRTEWIMTYDNVKLIRDLYADFEQETFELVYSANKKRTEKEILIWSKKLSISFT